MVNGSKEVERIGSQEGFNVKLRNDESDRQGSLKSVISVESYL